MAGYFLLCGGSEFQKGNEAADKFALEQIGVDAPVVVLPTAAAAEGQPALAGQNGVNWYKQQGASNVEFLPLYTQQDAKNAAFADKLQNAKLIYISGGNPLYLLNALKNSPALTAIQEAHTAGAILAGASAGAMVLLSKMYEPQSGKLIEGLGFVPDALFVPHFNNFGRKWLDKLLTDESVRLFCVEEKMAVIGRGGNWQVFGRGWVTIYEDGKPKKYQGGQPFRIKG